MKYIKTFEALTNPTMEKIAADVRDICIELHDNHFMIDVYRDIDNNEVTIRISRGIPEDNVRHMKVYDIDDIEDYVLMIRDYIKEYPKSVVSYKVDGRDYSNYENYKSYYFDQKYKYGEPINISFFIIKIKLNNEILKEV